MLIVTMLLSSRPHLNKNIRLSEKVINLKRVGFTFENVFFLRTGEISALAVNKFQIEKLIREIH